MNRDKEHCADFRNKCPVIKYIEDVLQVKLLPYQKLLFISMAIGNPVLRPYGRSSDCPLIEVELVEDEEAIVPVNMIGGYLKREAEHEEMSDQ